jgi:DNA repair exonuclease SbcCD ATPase subunit
MEIPKNFKIACFVLLVTITIFSVYKYVSALKEKYDLLNALNEIKRQVQILENDKQSLTRELDKEKQLADKLAEQNTGLKEVLKASVSRLTRLFADMEKTRKSLDDLHAQFSLLRAENTALKDQATQFSVENVTLKAKLGSVAELKKAIREFRKQMGKVGKEIKQQTNVSQAAAGNRGFLIKDGQPTFPPKAIKIEVTPAPAPAKE